MTATTIKFRFVRWLLWYLAIGLIVATVLNLRPGADAAETVFGPGWQSASGWWFWFVMPALTWPLVLVGLLVLAFARM